MAKLILKAPYYKRGHKTEDGRGRGKAQNEIPVSEADQKAESGRVCNIYCHTGRGGEVAAGKDLR